MPKLTKRLVDATKSAGAEIRVWDSEVKGFGLRVKPSGVKSFFINYRNAEGRQRRYTIGKHGVLTVEEARKSARLLLAQVARGGDPSAERETRRHAASIENLAEAYLRLGPRDKPQKKASSWKTDEINIRNHIVPLLGQRKAAALTRSDILRWQADVAEGKIARRHKTGWRGHAIVRGGRLAGIGQIIPAHVSEPSCPSADP